MRYILGIWCLVWCSVLAKAQNVSVNFQDTLLCVGGSFKLPYTVTNPVFTSGNVFTAELSNASGSFVSPITIGSKSSTVSDTISCIIPLATATGTLYRIRITASNPADISADNGLNLYISNYPQPVASITTPLCQGDTLTLFSSSPPPVDSHIWSGPLIGSIKGNPVKKFGVSLGDSGYYIVRAYYRGCRTNDTVHLTVKPNPTNIFSLVNTPLCEDDTLWLKVNSATATSYLWKGPNAFTAAVRDTFIANAQNVHGGKYYITAFLDGCKIKDSINVALKQRPRPQILFNTPVCEQQPFTIQTLQTVAGETYQWNGPDGFNHTSQSITITNTKSAATGRYYVLVSVDGCINKDSADVVVKPSPQKPRVFINAPLCAEDTLVLSCHDTVAGVAYSWIGPKNFSAANANTTIPGIDTSAKGYYIATADLNGCKVKDSAWVQVKIKPEQPIITSNSPVKPGNILYLELKNHRAGWGYKWSGPKGFFSQANRPAIQNVDTSNTGTYFVTVTYDGCTNTNMTLVQVDYKTDTGVLLIYPNPNNGGFNLRILLKKDQNADLRIVNAAGQEVYTASLTTKDKLIRAYVDVRNRLSYGVYFLTLVADDKKQSYKIVVEE